MKHIRILNRVITWTENAIHHEADHRHAELIIIIIKEMKLNTESYCEELETHLQAEFFAATEQSNYSTMKRCAETLEELSGLHSENVLISNVRTNSLCNWHSSAYPLPPNEAHEYRMCALCCVAQYVSKRYTGWVKKEAAKKARE